MILRDPKEDLKNRGVSTTLQATNPLDDFGDDWDQPLEVEQQDWDMGITYTQPPTSTTPEWDQPVESESPSEPYSDLYSFSVDDSEPTDELFVPQTFEEYKREQLTTEQDIDWTGAWDNSLIRHGVEWGRQAMYDWYVPEESVRGRQIQDMKLRKELETLGPVDSYDRGKQLEAKQLWDQRNELKFKNFLDEQAMNSEFPSMKELKDAVMENPSKFFKQMAQEVIDKPELMLLPGIAAARAGAAAVTAADAVGAGARATQVAVLSAEMIGAGAGGLTVGTLDRALQQSTNKGEIDMLKAMEQSQVDALLGVVLHGGGRALSKGVSSLKRAEAVEVQAKDFKKKATLDTETELDELRYREAVKRADEDPAVEAWVDENGNVYNYEVREVVDEASLKGQIVGLENLKKQAGTSKADREVLNLEIDRVNKEIDLAREQGGELTELVNKRSELLSKDIPTREQAAESWFTGSEKAKVVDNQFMQVTDAVGEVHTLKRLESPETDGVNIEGIQGIDLTGNFNVQAKNNRLMEVVKDYTVSATASLEKVAKMSPTAKLMLDAINPRARNGRAPIYTIQENLAYKQGQYTMKSTDIKTKMEELGVSEEALRDHMRGVTPSLDDGVLEVSTMVRGLLDEAKDYAKQKGMKLDEAKDFLPRYFDETKINEEMANTLADQISLQDMNSKLEAKYPREEVLKSLENIMTNTQRATDEQGPLSSGGKVQPIGHRSWKDVPDSVIAPALRDDFLAQIDRYLMNTVKRVEVDSVFGPNGSKIDEWTKKIAEEVEETGRGSFGKARLLTDKELENIKDIPKLLGGTYGGKATGKKVTDAVLATEMVTKLPLVTLTSIFEPVTILNRLNESSGIQDLVSSYIGKAKKSFNGVSKEQLTREAKEVGLVHDAAVQERLEAMVGEGLEGLPAKISKGAMKTFMLHQWTEHTRTMAYQAARNDLLKSIKGLAMDPKSSKSSNRQRWLAEMNINPKKAVDWYVKGADVKDPMFDRLKRGATRHANTMIANPNKINKGKLSSSNSSIARLVTQFKGFTNVYANDVVGSIIDESKSLWNQGDKLKALRKMSGLLATVSGMSYWTAYKTGLVTGEGVVNDDSEWEVAGKMTNGVTGMLVPGAAMIAPLAEGYGLSNVLGPAAGDAEKIGMSVFGDRKLESAVKGIAPTYSNVAEKIIE